MNDQSYRRGAELKQEVYVDVRHADFWWGIYALTTTTEWEDLLFYEKKGDVLAHIGSTCVCSRRYLESGLEDLADDPREKDFVESVKLFLQNDVFAYRYWYDEPESKDFHEVAFEAERNEKGVKPHSVEMWYPGDSIHMYAVEICTIAFCEKFLHRKVDTVLFKDIPPFEQIANGYREHMAGSGNGPVQIAFTDELVEALAEQWKTPEKEVRKILLRSV